jgi:DNA-binding HxlR family transcriptional regulator
MPVAPGNEPAELRASSRAEPASEERFAGLAAACEALGDRWSLPIVAALLDGPLRYTEIQERLPGLAPNILTARLRKLEHDGVLVATRYSRRPARFDYRLTADGAALGGAIQLLSAWASARAEPATAPTHADCGSELEMRWWCPSCELPVSPPGEESILA